MAHATHHHGSGGLLAPLLGAGIVALAILIGWAVWSGVTPMLRDRAQDIEIALPRAPTVPVPVDPQPMPMPTPTPPR
jgi:hypothetical protein